MHLKSLATTTLSLTLTALFTSQALADNTPNAEDLVGKSYLGGHGIYIKTDNDRLLTDAKNSDIDHGSGLGLEYGFRISPFYEARLSFSHLNLNTDSKGYDVPSGSNTAFDLLYFPNQANFYVVGGAHFLDVDKSDLSAALGAGYRHYLSKNTALYVESQGQYQLDDNHFDVSSKLGFVYFFGVEEKSAPIVKKQEPTSVAPPADSDKDGVPDAMDKCPKTPMGDKVNSVGCTLFKEDVKTMALQVNFDNDKAVIKDQYLPEIKKAADFLNQYPEVELTIHGHTSAVGAEDYNQNLSQKRAQAIVDKLVKSFGIDASRLSAVGHGEAKLLDQANNAQAHAKNRRIEASAKVTKKKAIKR